MKKALWILGTGLVCILYLFIVAIIATVGDIIANIATRSGMYSYNEDVPAAIIVFGWAVLIILSIWMWKRWNVKCHSCKRWGAMKLADTKLVKEESISVLMELKRRNSNRDVIGTQEQYVPGKRKTYLDRHKCKYCDNIETYTRTVDRASL